MVKVKKKEQTTLSMEIMPMVLRLQVFYPGVKTQTDISMKELSMKRDYFMETVN